METMVNAVGEKTALAIRRVNVWFHCCCVASVCYCRFCLGRFPSHRRNHRNGTVNRRSNNFAGFFVLVNALFLVQGVTSVQINFFPWIIRGGWMMMILSKGLVIRIIRVVFEICGTIIISRNLKLLQKCLLFFKKMSLTDF